LATIISRGIFGNFQVAAAVLPIVQGYMYLSRRRTTGRRGCCTIAEGDLVLVHARYTAGPGAPDIAVAEIFKVRGGKLVEHWDVISGPPEKVVRPNSPFDRAHG
jgi:predicted SnoaL-like aldol condensation-catalyzing enzyme